jgi:hypothetical protein
MRPICCVMVLLVLAGCAPHNKPANPSDAQADVGALQRPVVIDTDPAWKQYALAHYQTSVRQLRFEDPENVVFNSEPKEIFATYSPDFGTTLIARGEVQIRNDLGQEETQIYDARWATPGRAAGPNVPWQPRTATLSLPPTGPTTTTSPGRPR